jgi:hypothetical protein
MSEFMRSFRRWSRRTDIIIRLYLALQQAQRRAVIKVKYGP